MTLLDAVPIRVARFADLTTAELYALVRLRVDVFVVEQRCPYPELDGRDVEPGTEHVWTADDRGPTAYLRLLAEPSPGAERAAPPPDPGLDPVHGGWRVGRVCTRADARGAGLAARLLAHVLQRHPGERVVLDAQSYLVDFYRRFGFSPSGPEFVEDGIPHVPMARPARA